MKLELDHFFVIVDPNGKVADLLLKFGMKESFCRDHPGQGTSNRRFELSNSMFEIIWVRDADEANNGPGKELKFVERYKRHDASPFGIVLNRKCAADSGTPFDGWTYQPDYFEYPMSFHVGANSCNLLEPLCIYVPFLNPPSRKAEQGIFRSLSNIKITTPINTLSDVLDVVNKADRVSVVRGDQHLIEVTLDDNRKGLSEDFRPDLPLVINW